MGRKSIGYSYLKINHVYALENVNVPKRNQSPRNAVKPTFLGLFQ